MDCWCCTLRHSRQPEGGSSSDRQKWLAIAHGEYSSQVLAAVKQSAAGTIVAYTWMNIFALLFKLFGILCQTQSLCVQTSCSRIVSKLPIAATMKRRNSCYICL